MTASPHAPTTTRPASAPDGRATLLAAVEDPILVVDDVRLSFGGVAALQGVTFAVPRGQITGVIGPNGAGKTTLFDCISGFRRPDGGSIVLRAQPGADPVELTAAAAPARAALGVGRTFQNARLFRSVPIGEILRTVQHHRMHRSGFIRSVLGRPGARADERAVARAAVEAAELVGLAGHLHKTPAELSTGMLRLCELAAVATIGPRLLLLDEPAAGLAQAETEALGPVLVRMARHLDASVLLIEHDMPLVMGISDTIVALAAGATITTGPPAQVRAHPQVLESYLGAAS